MAVEEALDTGTPNQCHANNSGSCGTSHLDEYAATERKTTLPFYAALSQSQLRRYSRQMLIHNFGPEAQRRLLNTTVLIIGAGGLGCPASMYLAGAGVKKIILVDHDVVDSSNLHRQVGHSELRQGILKTESLAQQLLELNSEVEIETHSTKFSSDNGLLLVQGCDIVIDATDNPATRYMVNDACVLGGKPLVSGAALGMNGQLSVYNYDGGPCYRCLYPQPPPQGSFTSCADGGVLGPIPGAIGVLQALETIKIATQVGKPLNGRLLIWDGEDSRFRVVNMKGPRSDCSACSKDNRTIHSLEDTTEFCACNGLVSDEDSSFKSAASHEVSSTEILNGDPVDGILLDVRPECQFNMCHLEGFHNIPLKKLDLWLRRGKKDSHDDSALEELQETNGPVYVMCRRGNDSVAATNMLRDQGVEAYNIIGGYNAYRQQVDPSYPDY